MKQGWLKASLAYTTLFLIIGYDLREAERFHDLNERLRWYVVATADLPPGTRIQADDVRLVLEYLPEHKTELISSISSAVDRYTLQMAYEGKPLYPEQISPEPGLELSSDGAIANLPVDSEYTEGMRPGMTLALITDSGAAQESESEPNPDGVKKKNPNVSQKDKQGISKKGSSNDQENTKALPPLVVTLRTIVPSHDKKTTVLTIELPASTKGRLNELANRKLIPIIIKGPA